MKKWTKSLASGVLALSLLFGAGACSSEEETSVAGSTYTFASYTIDEEDYTETMTSMYSEWTLTFEEDGVCSQSITWADAYAEIMGSDPVVVEGTYEESDGTVTVTFASDEDEDTVMTFTAEDDTLIMDEDGTVTTFELATE